MTLLTNTEFCGLAADLMASMLVKQVKQDQRDSIWLDFVQAVAGVERRYVTALRKFFNAQMIAVLRRMPLITFASYRAVTKALVENWLFPTEEWIEPLVTLGGLYSSEALEISGANALDNLVLGINFQADTPEVWQALGQRNLRLSGVVNTESIERLRATLTEGVMEGESIPKLRKRVIELYGDFSRSRAEMIARTETIWASNEGVEQAWIQSRVVEGKEWLTAMDDRVDIICIEMEGKTAPLGGNFFDLGDSLTVTGANDREITAHFDFEEIRHPPIHPNCRCTLIPIVVEIGAQRTAEDVRRELIAEHDTDMATIARLQEQTMDENKKLLSLLESKGADSQTFKDQVAFVQDLASKEANIKRRLLANTREKVYVNPQGFDIRHQILGTRGKDPAMVAKFTKQIEDSLEEISKYINPDLMPFQKLNVYHKPGIRSHANSGGVFMTEVEAHANTVGHEVLHWIDGNNLKFADKSNAFFATRTENEAAVSLRNLTGNLGYDAIEVTKKDKFIDPYMGRVYKGRHSEIASMGIQHMISDPVNFAREDAEYFNFIYNLLRGK